MAARIECFGGLRVRRGVQLPDAQVAECDVSSLARPGRRRNEKAYLTVTVGVIPRFGQDRIVDQERELGALHQQPETIHSALFSVDGVRIGQRQVDQGERNAGGILVEPVVAQAVDQIRVAVSGALAAEHDAVLGRCIRLGDFDVHLQVEVRCGYF